MEVNASHKNYSLEYGPRRLRLAHSMLFEEFELIMEQWQSLDEEYLQSGNYNHLIQGRQMLNQ
jgi:hypothetical protein